MSASALSTFARYRDAVTDLVESGEPFGGIEDVIDHCELGDDLKAALWLVAYFNEADPAEA